MNWERDKTLLVLISGLVFFTLITLLVVYTLPIDGQTYTLFAGAFGFFLGALGHHLNTGQGPLPNTKTETSQKTETNTISEAPK
jgi:hypothetical protein